MTVREGSLEAPTRHPLNWKDPSFYDEAATLKEMERVFDICHGCRRCFNLCNAFPLLFEKVDEAGDDEVKGLERKVYWDVVDQCYLCDMCFMTKCPYVPPHAFNIDFPHLMLRAKAVKFRKGEARFRDKFLSNTDINGKLCSIPVVVQVVNAANKAKPTRALLDKTLGVHPDRVLPDYHSDTFQRTVTANESFAVRKGERTPGKVAIYSTCYINYNEPGIGRDLVKILQHNEIPYRLVEKEKCCGMPKLELGDLDSVEKLKAHNIPRLAQLAREGYAILAPVPSCALMYKQELPLLFADDADVQAVADAMFDPFEYFSLRQKDGLLKTDFKVALGKVSYHVPCHLRVQNIGNRTRDMLKQVPGTEINMVERCSGHSGTWGVKREFYEITMKIGRPVFSAMAKTEPDVIASDCTMAGNHIKQGMGGQVRKEHPISLLRIAYGL